MDVSFIPPFSILVAILCLVVLSCFVAPAVVCFNFVVMICELCFLCN